MSTDSASESSALSLGNCAQTHSGTSALTTCCVCNNPVTVPLVAGAVVEDEVAEDIKCVACVRGASEASGSLSATQSVREHDSALQDALAAMGIVASAAGSALSPVVLFSTALQVPTQVSPAMVQQDEQQAAVAASVDGTEVVVAVQGQQVDAGAAEPSPSLCAVVVGTVLVDIAAAAATRAEASAMVQQLHEEQDAKNDDEKYAGDSDQLSAPEAANEALLSEEAAGMVAAELAKIQEAEAAAAARADEQKVLNAKLQAIAEPHANLQLQVAQVRANTAQQQAQDKYNMTRLQVTNETELRAHVAEQEAEYKATMKALDAKHKASYQAIVAKQQEAEATLAKAQELRAKELAAKQKALVDALSESRSKKQALELELFAVRKAEHEQLTGAAKVGAAFVCAANLPSYLSAAQVGGGGAPLVSSRSVPAPAPPEKDGWSCNGWLLEQGAVTAKLVSELTKAEQVHGAGSSRARMLQTLLRRAKVVSSQEALTFVVRAATERNFCRFGTQAACPFGAECSFRHEPKPLVASRARTSSGSKGGGAAAPVGDAHSIRSIRSSSSSSSSSSGGGGSNSSSGSSNSSSGSSSQASRPSKTAARRAKERAKTSLLEQQVADLKKQIELLAQQQQQQQQQ